MRSWSGKPHLLLPLPAPLTSPGFYLHLCQPVGSKCCCAGRSPRRVCAISGAWEKQPAPAEWQEKGLPRHTRAFGMLGAVGYAVMGPRAESRQTRAPASSKCLCESLWPGPQAKEGFAWKAQRSLPPAHICSRQRSVNIPRCSCICNCTGSHAPGNPREADVRWTVLLPPWILQQPAGERGLPA